MRRLAVAAFWGSIAALVYAQAGYPLLLAAIARVRGRRGADGDAAPRPEPQTTAEPVVSLIVAAHREADVIAGKVANALALDWPRDRLEVIVACDGSPDDTPARARAAGADRVLELPVGREDPRPGRRRGRGARRPPRVLRRQRALGAGRAPRARRPVRRPARRLRLRPGALRVRRRHEPGGPVLALRDGDPRARVATSPRSPPATGRSTPSGREAYVERRPGHGPRPHAALHARQARAGARSTSRARGRARRWSRRSRASSPASAG